jgi:hypothetical protein
MSQQNVLIKPVGLYTYPNHLSSVPPGGLLTASNVILNRDNIVESRRGFSVYGNSMTSDNTAHQLITYKNRVIRHFGSGPGTSLEYDSDGSGTFLPFNLVVSGDTNSTAVVTNISSTAELEIGMGVTGSGILPNTTIFSIDSNSQLTLSQSTTSTVVSNPLTFTWNIQEVLLGRRIRSIEANGNLYFTSSEGIRKISLPDYTWPSSPIISLSGGIAALDNKLSLTGSPGFLTPLSVVAYRIVWGITDSNNNEILGSPSQRDIIRNTDPTNSTTVNIIFTIPQGISTAYFYQVYRTGVFSDPMGTQDPGDEEQLVFEGNPSLTDLNNGFISVTDVTPESFRQGGAFLYTNQNSGQGITQENNPPPLAVDLTLYQGYTFYANTKTNESLNLSLLSVSNFIAGTSNLTISDGTTTNTYTFNTAENTSTKQVLISTLPTPAQQVNETARSLVHVINSQFNEIVYASYVSGPSDVPGKILLITRSINHPAFFLTVDNTTTGQEFNPTLPTSGQSVISNNENSPNRVYYSKFQQPEAVPLLNFLDVGPKDKAIVRIIGLRDNLFVLKEDGIYVISGLVAPFTLTPFDYSTIIKAPDSAVVLNNLIYLYSTQGIGTISDTGVSVISRPIEDLVIPLLSPNYPNFRTATFGVPYESDRSYYLFTVTSTTDTFATRCFRYNTFTASWTELLLAKRSGIVNSFDDKLYLSPTDISFIEKERKSFDRTDYSDRELALVLGSDSVNGITITFPSLVNVNVDDIVVQTQNLTIKQFNQLLTKLDNDSLLFPHTYVVNNTTTPGTNLSNSLDILLTQISTDGGRTSVTGHTSPSSYTTLIGTGSSSFSNLQTAFNNLITLLNTDPGIGYKNYMSSLGTVDYEFNIVSINTSFNTITSPFIYPLIQGPFIVYNHINTELEFVPQYMQDVSITKQVSEGTLIFEDSSFSIATLSYASDLSANFEDQPVPGNGNGIFGNNIYGNGIYGGNGSGVPFRTYIPKDKQRCRYILVKFKHTVGREIFSLYGLSLTYNTISQRGWR